MARGFRYGGGAGQLRFREKYRPVAQGKSGMDALNAVLAKMDEDYKRQKEEDAAAAAKEEADGKD